MNRKKILVLVLVLLLAVSLVLLVRHRRRQLTRLRPPQAYAAVVRAAAVKRGRLEMSVRYLGEIVPVTESALAAKTTGFIEQILVEEGDPVTAGQLLVRIDDRDIRQRLQALKERERATDSQIAATRARVAGLRAAANTNREIFRRDEILRRQKAIGQEELDIARKNYRLAEAELQAAVSQVKVLQGTLAALQADRRALENTLNYTAIRAPFAGLVSSRLLAAGDLAVPGRPILRLVAPGDGVKVVVPVAPEDFLRLRRGGPAWLVFGGRRLAAAVSALYPATDAASRALCQLKLPASPFGLPFHSRLEVRLGLGAAAGLLAPVGCLLHRESGPVVVKIAAGQKAQPLPIELLGQDEKQICFRGQGLAAGDRLVRARESRLMRIFAGEQLEIIEEEGAAGVPKNLR